MRAPLLLAVLRTPALLGGLGLADWDLLLRQATAANLNASLHALAEAEGVLDAVPAPARRHLRWAAILARRHRQAVRWEVRQIGIALAATGVPLILLKGGAYAIAGLAAGDGRLFSDIDILVPKALLSEVEAALMMHGWAGGHHDEYDQRYYRQWMHELPPMQHVFRSSVIDVHHAILPETARNRPDPDSLRAHAVAAAPGVQVLAPVDMLLHSAVHLFSESEFDKGTRDLVDLHRLLQQFGATPGFWDTLAPRARALDLERALFYALRYCTRLLGTAVPPAVLTASAGAAPTPLLLALMDALFERALLPAHPSCARAGTGLARFCLYLRGTWLRMPPAMLVRHLWHKAFISPKKQDDAA